MNIKMCVIPLLLGIYLGGCRTTEDVSTNERYRPAEIVGRCFVLIQGGYVTKPEPGDKYASVYPPGNDFPPLDEFKGKKWDMGRYVQNYRIANVLEPGTKIKVLSIFRVVTFENDFNDPIGEILNGPYAGKKLDVSMMLSDLYGTQGVGGSRWSWDAEFLAPCDSAKPSSRAAEN